MKNSPDCKIYMGLFFISLSTLTLELLISRVMSVVAWYHFAFMAICLALFGMTVGAVIVHQYKESLLEEYHRALYLSSLIFSIALLINLIIICFRPIFTNLSRGDWEPVYHPFNIFLIFSSITIPLIGSGVCISLIFSRHVDHANKVYFVNLVGSSLGCLLFIPTINSLGVINSYFCLALLGLLAAYLFNLDDRYPRRKFLLILSLLLALFLWANDKAGLLELRWAKGKPDHQAFYKKWNSFSYIRLTDWGKDKNPIGWGFAPKKRDEIRRTRVEQIHLDIDAGAATVMTNFEDRDTNKIGFLKYDITALPYYLVNNGDVLVIGIGGGRDILTGILFNQKSITGVEINETILEIHKKLEAKFSGNLSQHPKVTLINNEARSYINSSNRKFDLIQLSLIDTFAATQAGAYALTENNLYTVEAFQTYWNHLSDQGYLSISYWMHPNRPENMLKLTGAATKALHMEGTNNPRAHLVIVHKDGLDDNRGVANLLVKKKPFSNEELLRIQKYCDEMGFYLILSPSGSADESFSKMSDAKSLNEYANHYKLNIAPASDDKPFFFLRTKFSIRKFFSKFKLSIFSAEYIFGAEYILFSLFVLMIVLTCLFVVFPLFKTTRLTQLNIAVLPFSIYFTAISLAFMFVEMSQLTRLSSFLGHPIYSLSVVLFSFLMSSGLGSYFIGQTDNKRTMITYTMLFISICLLSTIFTIPILQHFSKYSTNLRVITAIGVVFPLGFFMGSFLPQGVRLLGQRNGPVALFLGINGAMSVLGSILAMIFQITLGLNMTFLLGVLLYAVAIITLFGLKFSKRSAN